MRLLLFCTFFLPSITCHAQAPALSRDLEKDWLVHTDSGYQAYRGELKVQAIHIPFSARAGVGDRLEIQATKQVAVFFDNTLLFSGQNSYSFSVDSIRKAQNRLTFTLTIFGNTINAGNLSTRLVIPTLVEASGVTSLKPPTFFRDFIFVAAFIILLILLFIIRLNPKLASDYFSVTKIFSLRESEDSIVYTRITSSGNFLFYGFSSLTLGFFLLVIFVKLPEKEWIHINSFPEALTYWVLLSAGITLLFLAKMLVIYLFATLFNLREVAGMQFFNWVRLLFLTVGFSVAVTVMSIIMRNEPQAWFTFFYLATGWLLMLWVLLAFFKIAAKARIGLFHLFSYLCATEIIPSLIILKILYY